MLSLFVNQWPFGFGAFSFAFCAFLVPLLLFFFGPGACRPVACEAVSPVIWPKWHETLR